MELWKYIYVANKEKIDDPDLIYPGQKFVLPDTLILPAHKPDSVSTDSTITLEEFRKTFQKVMEAMRTSKKKIPKRSQNNGLEIGGLIINETISKIGDQFFNEFYQHWEAPENTPNFMLKITEKPLPSLGTMVTVQIDNNPVFRARLQPRLRVIEEQAKRALRISYQMLNRRFQSTNQVTVY
jgi:curli production assembly/transport component CsgE